MVVFDPMRTTKEGRPAEAERPPQRDEVLSSRRVSAQTVWRFKAQGALWLVPAS
jgi:hypothetical protein